MHILSSIIIRRRLRALLLSSCIVIMGGGTIRAQEAVNGPKISERSKELNGARKIKLEALRLQLREALISDDKIGARSTALELISTRALQSKPVSAMAGETSEAETSLTLKVWRQYYLAALALQPSDPVKATSFARQTIAEILASKPGLPKDQHSAAWLLVANFQEHIIGDGKAALSAYREAESAGADLGQIRDRTMSLTSRLGNVTEK